MKFYIASQLENATNAWKIADYLRYRGWNRPTTGPSTAW